MKAFDRKFGKEFVSTLPTTPGVYLVHNEAGSIIYVGKAKNLRRRLSQYRNAKRRKAHVKMRSIVREAHRVELRHCESDLEACLLETRLIQELRPRWNVEGAFYFLYPLIGIQEREGMVAWCYTTEPDKFPGFEFHGAFRSRGITGEGFFSLMRLLAYLGHPVPPATLLGRNWRLNKPKHSYVFGFRDGTRQPSPDRLPAWRDFLMGASHRAIEEMAVDLLENPDARRRSEEVQNDLRAVQRFWRHEATLLSRMRKLTGFATYPVPQIERDSLRVRYRFSKKERPQAPGARSLRPLDGPQP